MSIEMRLKILEIRLDIHLSSVQYWIKDWGLAKQAFITKFVPGQHYSSLGKKFNTYTEAETNLERNGYLSLGLRETFVYKDGN